MKKITLLFLLVFSVFQGSSNLHSQNIQEHAYKPEKCVQKYDIIVDAYYGVPYLLGNLYRMYIEDTLPGVMVSPRITNHIGGKVEYVLWNQLSFGLEYTYAALSFKYQGYNSHYYLGGYKKQRFLAKFNFHFATNAYVDPYLTAGLGYSITQTFSEEPNFESEIVNVIPVASRLGIGMRWFISDMFGFNFEAGLGGPLVQGGLSLKF